MILILSEARGAGPREAIAEDEDLGSLRGDPRFAALLTRAASGE
jgi:hypothetical protein